LLRVEPLKWWVISERENMHLPDIDRQLGTVLDLSHSRTWLRLSGDKTPTLLNHFLPIDLRESAFATGAVASTALHHVGITLWREAGAYSLLIPRSFALSLWELVTETAQQYGVAVN
jgi:heterotetrameric sarcosine oxidase gamma subunit